MKELPKSTPTEKSLSITSHLACSSHIHTPSSRIPPQTGFTPHHTNQSHWAVTPLLHHPRVLVSHVLSGPDRCSTSVTRGQRKGDASPGDRGTETGCVRETGETAGDRLSDRGEEAVRQETGGSRTGDRRLSERRQEAVGQETGGNLTEARRREDAGQETGGCRVGDTETRGCRAGDTETRGCRAGDMRLPGRRQDIKTGGCRTGARRLSEKKQEAARQEAGRQGTGGYPNHSALSRSILHSSSQVRAVLIPST